MLAGVGVPPCTIRPRSRFGIVLEGLRGEDSIAELCRREGIAQNLYYRWSKDFLEARQEAPGWRYRLGPSSAAAYTRAARAPAGSPISSSSAGAPYEARLSYS